MKTPLPPFPHGPCKSGESRESLRRYMKAVRSRQEAAFQEEIARRASEEAPEPAPDWVLDAQEAYYE